MAHLIEQRLHSLNLTLPQVPVQGTADLAWKCCAGWLHIGGQVPVVDGKVIAGRLGDSCDLQAAIVAAQHSALAVLAQIRQALGGDWARFDQLARIAVQISAPPDGCGLDTVARAASSVFSGVLGPCGTHVRTVAAVNGLPQNALLQIEAVALIRPKDQPIGLFP